MGTIFKISPTGAFTTLYEFVQVNNTGYVNGAYPNPGLIQGARWEPMGDHPLGWPGRHQPIWNDF